MKYTTTEILKRNEFHIRRVSAAGTLSPLFGSHRLHVHFNREMSVASVRCSVLLNLLPVMTSRHLSSRKVSWYLWVWVWFHFRLSWTFGSIRFSRVITEFNWLEWVRTKATWTSVTSMSLFGEKEVFNSFVVSISATCPSISRTFRQLPWNNAVYRLFRMT